jgi:hypothetical protein
VRYLLDNETLNGTHAVRITFRPYRIAVPIKVSDMDAFLRIITYECQIWSGANTAIIPISDDGTIKHPYNQILPGSAIDQVLGVDKYDLYDADDLRAQLPISRDGWGRQLAVALLSYKEPDKCAPVETLELQKSDPWFGIYAACLGQLPLAPDVRVLERSYLKPDLRFEDYAHIGRSQVSGSLSDLIGRLDGGLSISPRQLSMVHLPYGNLGSTSIRFRQSIIPDNYFARNDAGPNVVVVCSPGSVEDYILIWNLRAAHGDHRFVPIGIPLDEATPEVFRELARHPHLGRNGISAKSLYVTSATVQLKDLVNLVGETEQGRIGVGVGSYEQMLTLGSAAGWERDEVLSWDDGQTKFVPLPSGSRNEIFESMSFSPRATMQVDFKVLNDPVPDVDDVRLYPPNYEIYAGSVSRMASSQRHEALDISWPSRFLMAKSVAFARRLEISESEPGRAARVTLSDFDDIWDISNLAHEPLLGLLESMASRSGMSWARRRMRERGLNAESSEVTTAPTVDDLPEKSFEDFKRAFGNSDKATKSWLLWAERAGLIVKGFPLLCASCGAKQWTPVAAFSPPIVCRGCAITMATPFGDRPVINFKYRIAERLRRVYEHDAMGHLLAVRYFNAIFGRGGDSRLIGSHPGINVRVDGSDRVVGEADVLMFFRSGEFVPVEVKRSFTGADGAEVHKLDDLVNTLNAPWCAIAVCQYGQQGSEDFATLETRSEGGSPFRLILSYDLLLDLHPHWSMGVDPFRWEPLDAEKIAEREKEFVTRLAQMPTDGRYDWLSEDMLHRPKS